MNLKLPLLLLGLLLFAGLIAFEQSIINPISFIIETNYLSQPYDQKGLIKGGLFLFSYLFSLLALISILFIANRWMAVSLIALCSIIFGVDFYTQMLGSSPSGITVAILATALTETGRAADLLVYKKPLTYALAASTFFLIFALCLRSLIVKKKRIWFGWSVLALALSIASIGLLSYKIFSITTQSYPAPIKLPLVLHQYFSALPKHEERILAPSIQTSKTTEYQTIVWVIDESISGNYLGVNAYPKNTTPFLSSLQFSKDMQNYGVVNSVSNCSNTSNLFLRIGLTSKIQQDFKTAQHNLPTIFQYAKRAGFETYLMDGQMAPGEVQNHLTGYDLKSIDHYIGYPRSIYPKDRDSEILKSLATLMKGNKQKRFIVAVKWGAHWPYPLAYPQENAQFQPAATDSFTEMTVDNKEIIINAYLNAIEHSVDRFLKQLISQQRPDNSVIFYTSDHGQSLFTHDNSALTHCHFNTNPAALPLDEFKVPLMVFAAQAKKHFPKHTNRLYAQEQIFSSTLKLFGYDSKIFNAYGPTLWQGQVSTIAESYILDSGLKVSIPKDELQTNTQTTHASVAW
ncbi:sulfatase-like hydrolase/transferase [uncultured Thiothrix sp.]|uniref:sulfatase-like hydrolase/transferase n=1 Tax=uncultured Thiothrix sp. TaxID=223185 RepID=UPI0026224886|nr:sulfatase-like hydrolase/transferase [uncultured Thiothrix sp.]